MAATNNPFPTTPVSMPVALLTLAILTLAALPAAEVGLAWDANTEPDVAGYRIHYGELPGTPSQVVDAGNTTAVTIDNLSEGQTYSFYATCYNTAGLESDPSNTIEYTVPTTNPGNQPPVAEPGSSSTAEDYFVSIILTGTDGDGDPLTFTVVTGPAHGTLSGTAPNLTYAPAPNYHGSDNFSFKANDGTLDSATATVSITITPVNDAPLAQARSASTPENTPVSIVLAGSDLDGDPLTFIVVTGPAHGTLSGTAPNLIYTPTANYHGSDSFTFKVNDGTVDSATATVSITVTPENAAPVALAQSLTTAEDTSMNLALTATDADNDTLTFAIVSQPTHGNLSGTPPNLSYRPSTNYHGADSFTFRSNDGTVDSAVATVSITVTPLNDAPTAPLALAAAAGDRSVSLSWTTATDPDGDAPAYDIYRRTTEGSYSLPLARVSVPGFDDSGLVNDTTYYYQVRSVDTAGLGTDSAEVSATPNAQANRAYVVQDPLVTSGTLGGAGYLSTRQSGDGQAQTLQEKRVGQDVLLQADYLLRTSADPAQIAGLTLHLEASASSGSDLYRVALWNSLSGSWDDISSAIQGGSLSPTGDPREYVSSSGEIQLRFTDSTRGDRNEPLDTLNIDLLYAEITLFESTNQAPSAMAQSLSTLEDTALNVALTGTDPEHDPLTFTVVIQPAHGTLSGVAPNLTYTPSVDYNGTDSFTFKVNDGRNDSAPAPINLSITPVNDPPTVQDKTVRTPKGKPIKVELIASDPDGDALTYEIVSDPVHGTITGTAPDLTYTPSTGYVGEDEFIFVASDGQLESGTAPVTITIEEEPTELRITSTQLTDYGVILSWGSTEGTTYRVLYKTSLSDPSWVPLSETVGAIGTTTSYADRLAEQGLTLRYYLVERVD